MWREDVTANFLYAAQQISMLSSQEKPTLRKVKIFCDFDITKAIPICSSSGSFSPYILHDSKLVQ